VVVAIALLIRRDVGADEPCLPVLDARVRLGKVGAAGADGLDLGPGQHQARLERLLDGVVVARTAVEGDSVLRHRSNGECYGKWKSRPLRPALPSLPHEGGYRTASVVA
jgi:hypothetical protein